jgi:hypothetical protein
MVGTSVEIKQKLPKTLPLMKKSARQVARDEKTKPDLSTKDGRSMYNKAKYQERKTVAKNTQPQTKRPYRLGQRVPGIRCQKT